MMAYFTVEYTLHSTCLCKLLFMKHSQTGVIFVVKTSQERVMSSTYAI